MVGWMEPSQFFMRVDTAQLSAAGRVDAALQSPEWKRADVRISCSHIEVDNLTPA